MSDYDVTRIEKPDYFKVGPLMRGRGKRSTHVIGYDSEADTTDGTPMLLQFSKSGDESDATLLAVDGYKDARRWFLRYVGRVCTNKNVEYIIYGWNLMYEWTQLFGDIDDDITCGPDFEITTTVADPEIDATYRFLVKVANNKRYMAAITNLGTKRQIKLLDGYAFYKTGLDRAARMLDLGEKYTAPGLDRARFTRADLDDPDFRYYSARDAYITRRVGEYIIEQHKRYDVRTCISAPHFASTVFRHRFLDTVVEAPDAALEQAGLWSYHGGKNGHYVDGPRDFPNMHQYDITSAYPEAMRQLPDMTRAQWHKVRSYKPGRHAIYRVTLRYRRCKWRGFMEYDGHWPDSGIIENVHLTSYELDAMIERDECDILAIRGWSMEGPSGGPLADYVDEFFDLKRRSVGPERETAKLFLNSLYGKFFQKVALGYVTAYDMDKGEFIVTNDDSDFDWRAGGLYHPPIASLITGYVRARIHRLEHRYDAIMTSTDGIFATQAPAPSDLGDGLGDLTHQAGALRLWRERLYIFRPHDGSKPKVAMHGFRGTMEQLDAIPVAPGRYTYRATQLVTLKLAAIGLNGDRYTPGRFVELPYEINIGG